VREKFSSKNLPDNGFKLYSKQAKWNFGGILKGMQN
jgi:hypothetical protein